MKSSSILAGLFGLIGFVKASSGSDFLRRHMPGSQTTTHQMSRRCTTSTKNQTEDGVPLRFRNDNTERFYVDGSTLPLINWDVGESYAGNLPISDSANETSELFFWFFPTATPEFAEKKEIVIWLNGGPGCSSLLGFLEENGPISWAEGMASPQRNPFSFHLLTNMVWLEQPVGVGFTKGHETIRNEDDIAAQFIGFWRNFARKFGLKGWKVYIAGESYAGMYGPYLAQAMLDRADTTYYDMAGLLVYDGFLWGEALQSSAVVFPFLDMHYDLMPVDQPAFEQLRALDESCGFDDFRREYFVYPPKGPMPMLDSNESCVGIFDRVNAEALKKNPCFNIYNVVDRCPKRKDPLEGRDAWFRRRDVQASIHVGAYVEWQECSAVFPDGVEDQSDPAGVSVLPQVIDRTGNVIIAAGTNDYILSVNGILLGIQNMTWGGQLGFQQAPRDPFFVPAYGFDPDRIDDEFYDTEFYGYELPAGYGVMGTTHQERGLSFVVSQLAGHEGPEFAPAASFRILEKLLGRIDSLSEVSAFSLPQISNVTQPGSELGNGTVKIPCWTRSC